MSARSFKEEEGCSSSSIMVKMIGLWETVPIEAIQTPKDTFQSIIDEGYRVDYLRIPITDEQAPIPDVFDQLIKRISNANAGVDVLFNCQMGRGRTTTGMVTACLLAMIVNNDDLSPGRKRSVSLDSPIETRNYLLEELGDNSIFDSALVFEQ
ncbi:hypothetical protein K501DRAFT_330760 [Backusella circina FSU 941]|nr:hypothetical protein K501DRAFT_330760 [Backusella circina FSU 941]